MKKALRLLLLVLVALLAVVSLTSCAEESGREYLDREIRVGPSVDRSEVYEPFVNVRKLHLRLTASFKKERKELDFTRCRKLESVYIEWVDTYYEADASVLENIRFSRLKTIRIYVNAQPLFDYAKENLTGEARTVLVDKDFSFSDDVPFQSTDSVLRTDTIGYMFVPAVAAVLLLLVLNLFKHGDLIEDGAVFAVGALACALGVFCNVLVTFSPLGGTEVGTLFLCGSVMMGLGLVVCVRSLDIYSNFWRIVLYGAAYLSMIGIVVWICIFFSYAVFTISICIVMAPMLVGGIVFMVRELEAVTILKIFFALLGVTFVLFACLPVFEVIVTLSITYPFLLILAVLMLFCGGGGYAVGAVVIILKRE